MEARGDSDMVNLVERSQVRDNIVALEGEMLKLPQAELETNHYFAHGTYTRELKIPAGVLITGKIHRNSCINILTKGRIRVVTEEDDYDIEAPYVFVSGPGIKKAGYALEDSIWINVFPWDGKADVPQIESEVTLPNYDHLIGESA
jgi:hypothetical protein